MKSVDAGDALETENNQNGSGCCTQLLHWNKVAQILQTHQRLAFPNFFCVMLVVVAFGVVCILDFLLSLFKFEWVAAELDFTTREPKFCN